MGRAYFLSTVVTIVVAVALAVAFNYWRKSTLPILSERKILNLDQLETEGLPLFSGKDIFGNSVSLGDFRGKIVIVNFWASWCGPCLEEMPSMISLLEKKGDKIEMFAISGDSSLEDIQAFLKSFPGAKRSNIHIIWDENKEISRLYDVDRLPESFVGGADLKLAKKIVGSINWYTEDSLAFMDALLKK